MNACQYEMFICLHVLLNMCKREFVAQKQNQTKLKKNQINESNRKSANSNLLHTISTDTYYKYINNVVLGNKTK